MSTIKVEKIQHPNSASVALTLDTSGYLALQAGSASTPAIQGPSDPNTGIFFPAEDTIAFAEGGTEVLRIDSSGRVGIGTSSPGRNLSIMDSSGPVLELGSLNTAGNPSLFLHEGTNGSTINGGGLVYESTANRLDIVCGTTINTPRISVNRNSGNVGIGTTSPEELMHLNAVSNGSLVDLLKIDNSAGAVGTEAGIVFECGLDRTARISSANTGSDLGALKFWTAGSIDTLTERARIDSSGRLGLGITSPSRQLHVSDNTLSVATVAIEATNGSSTSGAVIFADYYAPNNSNIVFIQCNADQGGTPEEVFRVDGVGDVKNKNNSYGAISDARLKENIVDATSQWNDIKNIRVRKFNFIDEQTHTQIGVVAQEVELISPGLVSEFVNRDKDGDDLGTTTKSVNYSVLYMKAVKALQEAMERIEQLESEMAQVKAQLS